MCPPQEAGRGESGVPPWGGGGGGGGVGVLPLEARVWCALPSECYSYCDYDGACLLGAD